MNRISPHAGALALALALAAAAAAPAQQVSFKDPRDDDDGPGKYTYPTDPAYRPGSFDLTAFKLKARGDKVEVEVSVAAKLADPWNTGSGFSLQMVFIFIQTAPPPDSAVKVKTNAKPGKGDQGDQKKAATTGGSPAAPSPARAAPAAGFTQGLPGLNIQFAPKAGWNRCIILSPEPASRVKAEVIAKVPAPLQAAILVPAQVRGSGHTISATLDRQALGRGDPRNWGFQVVMAANDPFPAQSDLLLRKVNETGSQHRFGGGSDGDCDPNVLDVLAGDGEGNEAEAQQQHQMLKYECNPDGTAKKLATLTLVRVDRDEEPEKPKPGAAKEDKPAGAPEPRPETRGARLPAPAGCR